MSLISPNSSRIFEETIMNADLDIKPRENYVLGFTPTQGFYKIYYVEWGNPTSDKVVLCVHGLSRNGRDFDYLARELVQYGYRVVCPDLPGRGKSDWHDNPENYNSTQYANDLLCLIARLNVGKLDWIGTSMGGAIGMTLSSFPKSPIRKLVMNDVGPFIPGTSLQKIAQYLSVVPTFKKERSARQYLQQLLAPFGPLTPEQFDHMATHSFFTNEQGHLQLTFDPNILTSFKTEDVDLWGFWHNVDIPVLLLRGSESTVLTLEIAERMTLKQQVKLFQFTGIGHAPALMDQEQIDIIVQWLVG